MTLAEIRKRTGHYPNTLTTKQAATSWLLGLSQQCQFAVTLTFKQTVHIKNERGEQYRALNIDDVERAVARFQQKLNRQMFGNAAERYGKTLNYLTIAEGLRNHKNLHVHMAVGGWRKGQPFNQFIPMLNKAAALVDQIDSQKDLQIMDSGWTEYICKEIATNDTDNVLWQLTTLHN
jgi:hypothetical protein